MPRSLVTTIASDARSTIAVYRRAAPSASATVRCSVAAGADVTARAPFRQSVRELLDVSDAVVRGSTGRFGPTAT
jgi:hypothetical protein